MLVTLLLSSENLPLLWLETRDFSGITHRQHNTCAGDKVLNQPRTSYHQGRSMLQAASLAIAYQVHRAKMIRSKTSKYPAQLTRHLNQHSKYLCR
jgi:hypothetical protein